MTVRNPDRIEDLRSRLEGIRNSALSDLVKHPLIESYLGTTSGAIKKRAAVWRDGLSNAISLIKKTLNSGSTISDLEILVEVQISKIKEDLKNHAALINIPDEVFTLIKNSLFTLFEEFCIEDEPSEVTDNGHEKEIYSQVNDLTEEEVRDIISNRIQLRNYLERNLGFTPEIIAHRLDVTESNLQTILPVCELDSSGLTPSEYAEALQIQLQISRSTLRELEHMLEPNNEVIDSVYIPQVAPILEVELADVTQIAQTIEVATKTKSIEARIEEIAIRIHLLEKEICKLTAKITTRSEKVEKLRTLVKGDQNVIENFRRRFLELLDMVTIFPDINLPKTPPESTLEKINLLLGEIKKIPRKILKDLSLLKRHLKFIEETERIIIQYEAAMKRNERLEELLKELETLKREKQERSLELQELRGIVEIFSGLKSALARLE